jgi:predicted nuclease of predicted toxin-antitoxin system
MTIWVDAQLSPRTASAGCCSLSSRAGTVARARLRDSTDEDFFATARAANAIVLTKDGDFNRLLEQNGSLPKILCAHAATPPRLADGLKRIVKP